MEKKTKTLQLRKETIAVLNGERMSYVVGGTGTGCQMNGLFYQNGEVVNNDGNECVCINGNWQCGDSENIDAFKTRLNCPPTTIVTCYSNCQCQSLQGCLTKKGC